MSGKQVCFSQAHRLGAMSLLYATFLMLKNTLCGTAERECHITAVSKEHRGVDTCIDIRVPRRLRMASKDGLVNEQTRQLSSFRKHIEAIAFQI